jgi:hypothetical protein
MKQNTCQKNPFLIKIKEDKTDWMWKIAEIHTPTTVTFAISAANTSTLVKKITWDFGNGNKHKTITNRKQELIGHPIECRYKKTNDKTLSIQASVYTDKDIFITHPLETVTVNNQIKEHYIDPEEFKNEIITYYRTNVFENNVASSIYKIANRLAFSPNFINYTYREDMVGDAVIRMVEALTRHKFRPEKGNPFSYFTKIAFNAFCNRIKKEKRLRETLTNYRDDVYNGIVDDGIVLNQHEDLAYEDT